MIGYAALGGFFGAMARYMANHCIRQRTNGDFPWPTFIINLTGSFLLGLFWGIKLPTPWLTFLGTGFLGAFTTFSTFKMENVRLLRDKKHRASVRYILFSCAGGILLAYAGYCIGRMVL